MQITPFALERYFAKHEFSARHLLSSSDCEALTLEELLAMADDAQRRQWDQLKLAYTETAGHPQLREAIAGLYDGIDADDVLVVVPEEGIFLLMHALLKAGDHVVCVAPAYQSLHEVATAIGCEVDRWLPEEDPGWHFDLAALEALLRDNTRLVVLNFPHNPTGFAPSREDFEAMVDLVHQHGAFLLSDEMYRLLEVEAGSTLPAACELNEHAACLFGLSKSFGLPGLRIGWMASRDRELLDRMSMLKDYTTICASAPSEILAIIAMANRQEIVGQQVQRVRRNLAAVDSFMQDFHELFAWTRPVGGSVCFPRYLGPESTTELAEQAVSEAGIMLVPSALFDFGERHLRIGYGRENLPEVLDRFADFLQTR